MANSNFYSYIAQLKMQARNSNPVIADKAQKALNYFDRVTKLKEGKPATEMTVTELKRIPFDISLKAKDHNLYWGGPKANFLGIFGKKHRKKREKLFGDVGKVAEKVGRGVGKGVTDAVKGIGSVVKDIGKLVTHPQYIPLLPFKGAMRKALSKRNINVGDDIKEIANSFYKNVVKKHNYEGYESYYHHLEPEPRKGNFAPLVALAGPVLKSAEDKDGNINIGSLIKAVLSFFNMAKKKVEDGIADPEEKELVSAVAATEKQFAENPTAYGDAIRKVSYANQGGGSQKDTILWVIIAIVAAKLFKLF